MKVQGEINSSTLKVLSGKACHEAFLINHLWQAAAIAHDKHPQMDFTQKKLADTHAPSKIHFFFNIRNSIYGSE